MAGTVAEVTDGRALERSLILKQPNLASLPKVERRCILSTTFQFQLKSGDGQDMSRVINGTKEAGVHPHHVFG